VVNRRLAVLGAGLVATGIILMAIGAALGSGPGSLPGQAVPWGFGPGGMMGFGATNAGSAPDPGSPGFVAGTVRQGETITFEVTSMGMLSHEFMVGPAADVAADTAGTPEVADISMMQTKSLTYTFTGSGPFAFACHAPGHYEAGMRGTIVIVG
jgi:plastocyanin